MRKFAGLTNGKQDRASRRDELFLTELWPRIDELRRQIKGMIRNDNRDGLHYQQSRNREVGLSKMRIEWLAP